MWWSTVKESGVGCHCGEYVASSCFDEGIGKEFTYTNCMSLVREKGMHHTDLYLRVLILSFCSVELRKRWKLQVAKVTCWG